MSYVELTCGAMVISCIRSCWEGRFGAMMLKTRYYSTNVIKILFSYVFEAFEKDTLMIARAG